MFTPRRTKGADGICGSFTRSSLFGGQAGYGTKGQDGLGKLFGGTINGADEKSGGELVRRRFCAFSRDTLRFLFEEERADGTGGMTADIKKLSGV
jgi:hypothetical protein